MKEQQGLIYYFRCLVNGKGYVGQHERSNENVRWRGHKSAAFVKNINHPLYNAMRLYGWESFEKSVIWRGATRLLNEKETYYIKALDTFIDNERGYNLTTGGCAGMQFSKKSLSLLSKRQQAVWCDPAYRAAKDLLNASAEHRANISVGCKKSWENPDKRAAHLEEVRSPRRRKLACKKQTAAWQNPESLAKWEASFAKPEFKLACAAASRSYWESLTPEQRKEHGIKASVARRTNAAKKVAK